MFFNKENTSIRSQLITMQVATAILAILLVSGIGIFNAIYHVKQIQKENLIWFSDYLSRNISIYFDPTLFDAQGYKGNMDEDLSKQKRIDNVSFFTNKGLNFYKYPANSDFNFILPLKEFEEQNTPGILNDAWGYTSYVHKVYEPVESGGDFIGYICIKENKNELYQILTRYMALTLLSLFSVGCLAYYLARRLQGTISDPILRLNDVVSNFGATSTYNSAPIGGSTELAQLGSSFNEMVAQIEDRDRKLKQANENLENEVEQRTNELKNTVVSLALRTKELKATNKELEQFAYIASHDLQEPLRSIGSFTQLLERKLKKANVYDEEAQEYFSFIVGGSKRMQAVIKDVLLFSGINEKPDFIATDLNAVLKETIMAVHTKIAETNTDIQIPFPLPTVEVDPKQIPHLFQNLITNAIKFRNKEIPPQITVSYKEKGQYWEFFVRDNGIGIGDEYKEKIFRMFKRLHSKEEYPGTGIGLAICKKIVEAHEGDIWVDSEPGKGSTFYFTIKKNLKYHSMMSSDKKVNVQEDNKETLAPLLSISSS